MSPVKCLKNGFVGIAMLIFGMTSGLANTEIQFWTMQLSPFHDEYVHGLINEFEADNPGVSIKWVDVPWKEMEKKMLASVAAKRPPDVVNMNPQFSSKLAEYNALADPRDYLSESQTNQYIKPIFSANSFNSKTFAVPWYLSTTITIYNKKILADAEAKVPTNHHELLIAAQKIKKTLDKYAYFPAMDGSRALEDMVTMGAQLANQSHTGAGFNTTLGRDFFKFYRDLYQQDLVPRNVLTEGHHKAVELFQSGELGMITTGMQFLNTIKINAPEIFKHIAIAPQLTGPNDRFNVAMMNLAVPMLSKHKALAFKFAVFVTNNKNQIKLAKRVPILPSTRQSYNDIFFQQRATDSVIEQARYLSAKQVLNGEVLVPPLPKYSKLRTSFVRNLQSAMVEEKTITEALDDAEKTWALFLGANK